MTKLKDSKKNSFIQGAFYQDRTIARKSSQLYGYCVITTIEPDRIGIRYLADDVEASITTTKHSRNLIPQSRALASIRIEELEGLAKKLRQELGNQTTR